MNARQHAKANADRTHGARIATVDARLAAQDLAAHDARFEIKEDVFDGNGIRDSGALLCCLCSQFGFDFRGDLAQLGRALLLLADLVGGVQAVLGRCGHRCDQSLVLGGRLPIPFGLASVAHQVVDRIDHDLHLRVTEHHATEHDFLGKLVSLGFDHQHCGLGTGNDQVHLGGLELRSRRVDDVLAVDVTHARGANRAVKGDAGDCHGSRCANHGRDIGIDFRVDRQHVDDDLDFVIEAFRKQGAQGAIDQAGGEGFLFGRLALALEETAGDLARCVGFFDVVDGQGEKILARLGLLGRNDGCQHDGVVNGDEHGAARLTRDFARLEHDGVLA